MISDAQAKALTAQHCSVCHALEPTQPGWSAPPAGMVLSSREDVLRHAAAAATAVSSGYMPLANMTGLQDDERAALVAWMQSLATQ